VTSNNTAPTKAFILAAGMGTRLRPMTDNCPKPLVKVNGKPIIDYVLDDLIAAGVRDVVVNTHYLAGLMESHLAARGDDIIIHISREDELLETGGGLKKGLHFMKGEPFYVVSGDSFWENGTQPALQRLAEAWNEDEMDMLLMLQPVGKMTLTGGVGDYDFVEDGKITRSLDQTGDYMWTSVRICKPEIFDGTPDGAFSFLQVMDAVEATGRLHGMVHDGEWHHISTPDDLAKTDEYFKKTPKVA
jgi:MurNAc alpha-1-phosphate uridylyltransferase